MAADGAPIDEVEHGLLDRPLNLRPVSGIVREPLEHPSDGEPGVEAVEDRGSMYGARQTAGVFFR